MNCRSNHNPAQLRAAKRWLQGGGFTLIELLVAMVLFTIIISILLQITAQTQDVWSNTKGKLEQMRESRDSSGVVSRSLRQATLNAYLDYEYPGGDDTKPPTSYRRQSELRFISGPVDDLGIRSASGMGDPSGHAIFFQAPLGRSDAVQNRPLNKLLNTVGYFVDLRDGKDDIPAFYQSRAKERWRMRLYEFIEPSENLTVYQNTSDNPDYKGRDWFTTPLSTPGNTRMIAENVVAFIVRPKYSIERKAGGVAAEVALAPDYTYDSGGGLSQGALELQLHQLPPTVQISIVVIDEESAIRLKKEGLADIGSKVDELFDSKSEDHDEVNLRALGDYLTELGVGYKIDSNTVSINGAKQTQSQTQ